WLGQPAPSAAPAIVPPPPHDDLLSWDVRLNAPAAPQQDDAPAVLAAPPASVAEHPLPELRAALAPPLVIDASAAVNDVQPAWLTERPAAPPDGAEPIPVPPPAGPSEADRGAALGAGLWLGGQALAGR